MMNSNNIDVILNAKNDSTYLWCTAFVNKNEACMARMTTNDNHSIWTISAWYTKQEYQNIGLGKKTLGRIIRFLYEKYGLPVKIEYIWNGTNEYVHDWMVKHFDAECKCPIWIQKTQSDDDWSSHIYELNVEKVIKYFDTRKD